VMESIGSIVGALIGVAAITVWATLISVITLRIIGVIKR
jgi:hypothetical protein